MTQAVRLRKELEETNKQLQDVLAQNEMYRDYIESLLEYNNKLVTIIEKQLKIGGKVQSNLQPISQRTENDSQMISDNKSLSIRAMRTNSGPIIDSIGSDRPAKNTPTVQLEQIQEQPHHPKAGEGREAELYRQIYGLIENYQEEYIAKKDYYKNAFKQIIESIEQDRQKFNMLNQHNLQILEDKRAELEVLMNDIKALSNNELISKLIQKSKNTGNQASNIHSKGKRV